MKTYIDVLEDTREFYTHNPRAVDFDGNCVYLDPDGNKCAFSRYLDPFHEGYKEIVARNHSANDSLELYGFGILDETVRHLDAPKFWDDVQEFHDSEEYWGEGGLSDAGMVEYDLLCKRWGVDKTN